MPNLTGSRTRMTQKLSSAVAEDPARARFFIASTEVLYHSRIILTHI